MSKFSEEFGYSSSNQKQIIESAPIWLRKAFVQDVLGNFLGIYFDNFIGPLIAVINTVRLMDRISIVFQRDFAENRGYFDKEILYDIKWYEFYDMVEIIGKEIKNSCDDWNLEMSSPEFDHVRIGNDCYYYLDYIEQVNNFFKDKNVRWRLDSDCKFQLLYPTQLEKLRDHVDEALDKNGLKTTYQHFQNSENYFSRLPVDSPNSIKEIVQAIESFGTVIYPSIQKLTLTKMVKEMEKENIFPDYFLKIIQSFYNYACSEPGIRHGKEEPVRVRVEDAEFCFYLGIAILYYIKSLKEIV